MKIIFPSVDGYWISECKLHWEKLLEENIFILFDTCFPFALSLGISKPQVPLRNLRFIPLIGACIEGDFFLTQYLKVAYNFMVNFIRIFDEFFSLET